MRLPANAVLLAEQQWSTVESTVSHTVTATAAAATIQTCGIVYFYNPARYFSPYLVHVYIHPLSSLVGKMSTRTYLRLLKSYNTLSLRGLSTHPKPDIPAAEFFKPRVPRKSGVASGLIEPLCNCEGSTTLKPCSKSDKCQYRVDQVPVFIKTYGCQMNLNDTSIVASILQEFGYKIVADDAEAEIHLLMTCAIRDSAEQKIWKKLTELKYKKARATHPLKQIGLLGCMAEHLKTKVLETNGFVDIVAGPDAYRDLPRLFAVNKMTNDKAINCLLSFDETYSDIRPATNVNDVTSFISITRGCDNLCSYCIVPFTRGKERSRAISTILDEVRHFTEKGIKEVTLLGQNVNSYRDLMTPPESIGRNDLVEKVDQKEEPARGFKTVYKPRTKGITFDVLLEEVAKVNPELRIRFTSPHPKDFTGDVIEVMARYNNICKCLHLPAQSGSNSVLERMRRGYTKQAYLDLVDRLRQAIPELAITSDFIAGFCGETEADHLETMDLIERVKYNYIYAYPYSLRDKTHAYHRLKDDVGHATKLRRADEILKLFREQATEINTRLIGTQQLILIEADSRRSELNWQGRVDSNVKAIIPKKVVMDFIGGDERAIRPGDYVECLVTEANSQTLQVEPLNITTQAEYNQRQDRMKGAIGIN